MYLAMAKKESNVVTLQRPREKYTNEFLYISKDSKQSFSYPDKKIPHRKNNKNVNGASM